MFQSSRVSRLRSFGARALSFLCLSIIAAGGLQAQPSRQELDRVRDSFDKPSAEACANLDDPKVRGRMDGLMHYLPYACERYDLLGFEQLAEPVAERGAGGATDVPVSDPSTDTSGTALTQNETSIAVDEVTGTVCSGYNDAFHGVTQGTGFSGFSRSTDGGATFTDQGPLGPGNGGDPSLVWRKADGHFYYAVLASGSLGLWRSTDDCVSFTNLGNLHTGTQDDKEIMAVDNTVASAGYGNLYVGWTDFTADGIFSTFSADAGATWSTPFRLTTAGESVQGAYPAVAPNGDVYMSWVEWTGAAGFPNGDLDIEVALSTDQGVSYTRVTSPLVGGSNPRDAAATSTCGRPALNENIRYLPSPQVVVGPDAVLHTVYSYDQVDGDSDEIDVFYRRSTDSGATWGTEVKLNGDATSTDQFFPSISVGPTNVVVTAWYDRRLSATNEMIDYYQSTSFDGGVTWQANERISDVSSPVNLDPNLAACYHGDYDQQVQVPSAAILQWGDDRAGNPDVFSGQVPLSTDFLLTATPLSQDYCLAGRGLTAQYTINSLQFQGFTGAVTLVASDNPAGTSTSFNTNPITTPGSTNFFVHNLVAAAAGSYQVEVTGTADITRGTAEHSVTVGLNIFSTTPGAPSFTFPTDGATDVADNLTFTWGDTAQSRDWAIEIATDSGFSNIVESASGIAALEYTATLLDSATVYYARLSGSNVCGASAPDVVMFTTAALPGDCLPGASVISAFDDDFESGATGWTTGGTGSTWVLAGINVNSGSTSWHGDDVGSVTDQHLVSPEIVVPAGDAPHLQFWNRQEMEDRSGGCFDGGVLEISTNSGGSWTRIESELQTDPYDGPISDAWMNPLVNENAWCGDPQEGLRSVVDLTAFVGQTVQFRFRLATDVSVSHPGWDIDDVRVRACSNESIFADGFETGDTALWDSTTP